MSELPNGYRDRPDYRVDVLARTNLITAEFDGRTLASSDACLLVDEQDHGLVVYFPPESVDLDALEPVEGLHTICPFKGQASYWKVPGAAHESVAWTYRDPHPPAARIAGYIAFDQSLARVSIGPGHFTGVRP
ncbi:MAG: DUF427 domain-containing protein [Nocardia sp.]|nr:DUF427 domain-containing protein [Nocardia sp.]